MTTDGLLHAGQRVVFVNLQSRAELNGTFGRLKAWNPTTKRWLVNSGEAAEQYVNVRPSNFEATFDSDEEDDIERGEERMLQEVASNLEECFNEDGVMITVIVPSQEHSKLNDVTGCPVPKAARTGAGERKFKVWAPLLMKWSEVFERMLSIDMREKTSGQIRIADFSAASVEAFLKCMYSGALNVCEPSTLCEVVGIAEKYAVKPIRSAALLALRKVPRRQVSLQDLGFANLSLEELFFLRRTPSEIRAQGLVWVCVYFP